MADVTISIGTSIGGQSPSASITKTAGGQMGYDPLLDPAQAGSLTTRTDNTSGVVTLAAAPTVGTGNSVTLKWGTSSYRHGVDVTATGALTVTFSGGFGDNLPVQDTAIIVCKEVVVNADFPGDKLKVLELSCTAQTYIAFDETTGTTAPITSYACPAGGAFFWYEGCQYPNPFAGLSVGAVLLANLDTTQQSQVAFGVFYDSGS